jgi:hypothetical protein
MAGMATPRRPTELIAPHHRPLDLRAPVLCAHGKISHFLKWRLSRLAASSGGALYKAVDWRVLDLTPGMITGCHFWFRFKRFQGLAAPFNRYSFSSDFKGLRHDW